MTDAPSLDRIQGAMGTLLEIAAPIFPITASAGDHQRIAALMARIVGSARAALTLSELDRRADLAVVVRSMYEHVVMFAWLTARKGQTHERLLLWQRYTDEQILKFDNDTERSTGQRAIDAASREQMEADHEYMGKHRMPGLADRAAAADREWAGRGGFGTPGDALTLREVYRALYRPMSGVVHPTQMGLELVTERDGKKIVVDLEPIGTGADSLAPAAALLASTILMSSLTLGRPPLDDVDPKVTDALDHMLE